VELKLYNKTITCKAPVVNKEFIREETVEINLPESMPDVVAVIDAKCTPFMRAKDAVMGRAEVSGVCDAAILFYTDASTEIQRLATEVKFLGACEDEKITPDCAISAQVVCVNADARMLNSRKLSLRFELMYSICCYDWAELGSVTIPEETGCLRFKGGTAKVTVPMGVGEKSFVLTDRVKVTADGGVGELMYYDTDFCVDDIRSVGSKAVVKGTADTRFAYRTGEDGSQLAVCSFKSPFSQIVDLDMEAEADFFEVQVMTTGLYLDRDLLEDMNGETVAAEINAVIQCTAFCGTEIKCVEDAYSTEYEIEPVLTSAAVKSCSRKRVEDTFSVMADIRDVTEVIWCDVRFCGKPEIRGEELYIPVCVKLLYKTEQGTLEVFARKYEYKATTDIARYAELCIVNTLWEKTNCTVRQDGVQISASFAAEMIIYDDVVIETIEQVVCDEERRKDRRILPSLTAYRVRAGDSLWTIAKKYSSAQEYILAANGMEEDDTVIPGSVILIPKA